MRCPIPCSCLEQALCIRSPPAGIASLQATRRARCSAEPPFPPPRVLIQSHPICPLPGAGVGLSDVQNGGAAPGGRRCHKQPASHQEAALCGQFQRPKGKQNRSGPHATRHFSPAPLPPVSPKRIGPDFGRQVFRIKTLEEMAVARDFDCHWIRLIRLTEHGLLFVGAYVCATPLSAIVVPPVSSFGERSVINNDIPPLLACGQRTRTTCRSVSSTP
jgi:hypothetical protein